MAIDEEPIPEPKPLAIRVEPLNGPSRDDTIEAGKLESEWTAADLATAVTKMVFFLDGRPRKHPVTLTPIEEAPVAWTIVVEAADDSIRVVSAPVAVPPTTIEEFLQYDRVAPPQ